MRCDSRSVWAGYNSQADGRDMTVAQYGRDMTVAQFGRDMTVAQFGRDMVSLGGIWQCHQVWGRYYSPR